VTGGGSGSQVALRYFSQYYPAGITFIACDSQDLDDGKYIEAGAGTIQFSEANGGCIDGDPLFHAPGSWDDNDTPSDTSDDFWVDGDGDYHLETTQPYGRYDEATGEWQSDEAKSPCIDAGKVYDYQDPTTYYADEPFFNGYRVNQGFYAGTPYASGSSWYCDGDVNFDKNVNILDLIQIRNNMNLDPSQDDRWRYNVKRDERINILDLIFVRNRLGNKCP